MANSKISALTAATTPVAGTETLPIVQSGATKQVSIANLTAGRAVSASSFSANTTNVFAKVSVELTGGNAILARYNSSNKPAGLYTGGTSGESFFGANLNWSSGNVFNYQITGLMWYLGDPGGSGTTVSLGLASGTAGNSAGVDTLSTAVAKWDTSGNYTMVNGNIVPATAAKGINFTANTATSGSTSRLLNWYEEGDWTPTLVPASGTITLNTTLTKGKYVRIGRQVTMTAFVYVTSVSSPSGALYIGGSPFAVASGYGFRSAASVVAKDLAATATTSIVGYVIDNATANVYVDKYAAGVTAALSADIKADTSIIMSVTFFV